MFVWILNWSWRLLNECSNLMLLMFFKRFSRFCDWTNDERQTDRRTDKLIDGQLNTYFLDKWMDRCLTDWWKDRQTNRWIRWMDGRAGVKTAELPNGWMNWMLRRNGLFGHTDRRGKQKYFNFAFIAPITARSYSERNIWTPATTKTKQIKTNSTTTITKQKKSPGENLHYLVPPIGTVQRRRFLFPLLSSFHRNSRFKFSMKTF